MKWSLVFALLTVAVAVHADGLSDLELDCSHDGAVLLALNDVEVLGEETSAYTVNDRVASKMAEAREFSKRGASVYFVGVGLNYAVALPLNVVAIVNENVGLAIMALGVQLASSAMQIAGPIRNGVGASLAYDAAREADIPVDRNTNWGYYRTGWVLTGIGAVVNLFGFFSQDMSTAVTLSLVSAGLGLGADALWITSVINSLGYTKRLSESAGVSRIHLRPYLGFGGRTGMNLAVDF